MATDTRDNLRTRAAQSIRDLAGGHGADVASQRPERRDLLGHEGLNTVRLEEIQ